jgi:hypothetical protein
MFLDSLCGDAAWLGRYARDRAGTPVPWALLERSIREKQPYEVGPHKIYPVRAGGAPM